MSQPQTGTLADLAVWLFACAVGQPVQVCSVCPQTGEPIDRSAYYLERCLELAVTLLANAPYMERGQCDYARWTHAAPYAPACGGFA